MLETPALGFLSALLLSLSLTPLIRWAARHYGFVAVPQGDRWHQRPTALLGGIGIFLAFVIPFAVFSPPDHNLLFVMAGATVIFGLGIVDDTLRVQPYTKLVVQIAAASLVTFGSLPALSQNLALFVIPLGIFWLVALTNAFNLLDNMDGLSAGTACIASVFLFLIAYTLQSPAVALCAAILCGATLGFLFYNFYPATIFMGDSGSMFLGFVLASLTMKGNWEQATNLFLTVLTPVLILAVPIFDTTFVTLVRWINNRAISIGGRDHSSHRLVTFGLSEKKAVALFYSISAVCGSIAFLGVKYNAALLSVLASMVVIVSFYFGMFLSGVVVYGTEGEVKEPPGAGRGVVLNIFLLHKRRILEVLLDMGLVCLAYVAAFVIRFEGEIPRDHFTMLARSLPVIIPLKLLVFASFGLYRGVWRHLGIPDAIGILKAVTVSSLLAVAAMTMLFRFSLFPRSVFIIDWMALLLLVAGCRILIRVIRNYLFSLSDLKGKRVVIVGAGDAGVLTVWEFKNNAKLGYTPVGFFDDDPDKHGRRIQGVPVLGGTDKIHEMVVKLGIEQIVVAMPSVQDEALSGIIRTCEATGVPVTVMPSLADLIEKNRKDDHLQGTGWKPEPRAPQVGKEPTWN